MTDIISKQYHAPMEINVQLSEDVNYDIIYLIK